MTPSRTNRILTRLHRAALRQEYAVTDAQLLERFLARREESAFEELVRRHGPMVLGVCRRVLGEPHDAEDAFQATFLVFVRRAADIVPRSRVGPWLYGVARRTALKARSSAARRRRAEQQAGHNRPVTTPASPADDLRPLLDEELGRLPEKYCAPLVLCLLEGKSRREAAGLLGWSEGTLSGRLARAKELLGRRLRRRGVAPAGAVLAAAVVENTATAELPARLVIAAVKAAASFFGPAAIPAASAPVIALTEEVLKAMLTSKLKAVAGVVLLVAGIGFGAGAVARQYGPPSRSAPRAEGYSESPRPAAADKERKAEPKPPAYVIESPDALKVVYGRPESDEPVKIAGQRLVRPDGTIGLGMLGSVSVAGRTAEEARAAIAEHLAGRLDGFDPKKLTVEVSAPNSKFLYVIADAADGTEQICRLPATGSETVVDAAVGAKVPLLGIGQNRVYVLRPTEGGTASKVLPVDWKAITLDGDPATNHPLRPGDRVYFKKLAPPKKAEAVRRPDGLQSIPIVGDVFTVPKKAEAVRRPDGVFLNERNFSVPFVVDDAQRRTADRLLLLVSDDAGRSYRQVAEAEPQEQRAFRVRLESDGTYWFVLQVRHRNGRVEPADVMAAEPVLKVCVDTQPPEVTLWRAKGDGNAFDLWWEVRDANLDVESLRLECRPEGRGAWLPLAIPKTAKGRESITLPEEFLAGPVELRLLVRDRAGNIGKAEGKLR
jgi:RNA polymerase sigma factor (sigma-70 family)